MRYLVKVFLYQIEPEIWRRFSIPSEATFRQLHDAIQQSMGWEDKQWHEFRHGKGKRLLDVIGVLQELRKGAHLPRWRTFESATAAAIRRRDGDR